MREIKFRAFGPGVVKSENTMIYNVAISEEGKYLVTFMDYTYEVRENYILMQYTGLKDANGKEIYEGDITLDGWVIKFSEGMFIPYVDFGRQERYEDVGSDWWSNIEVIGNIYENAEILEKFERLYKRENK